MKLTPAQKRFLKMHTGDEILGRFQAHKKYDFVGRVRAMGLVEIIDHNSRIGWPYIWEGTRLTDVGRAALSESKP